MVEKRTLKRIIWDLAKNKQTVTRFKQYRYIIDVKDGEIIATPQSVPGQVASSLISFEERKYTEGGKIFQIAVRGCHEIKAYRDNFLGALDTMGKFLEDITEFDGKYTRYFDSDQNELAMDNISNLIEEGNPIYVLQWMDKRYKCVHEYNTAQDKGGG